MPRLTVADVMYALCHPLRALRYLQHRDTIPSDLCRRYLPENPVIVEAGAFDGTNSREFVTEWVAAAIYAFEPVPTAFTRLSQVAALFPGKIFPQPLAVGRQPGKALMHVSGASTQGEQSSSLLQPTGTRAEFPFVDFSEQTIEVPVATLDDWAAGAGIAKVDFLWLDLQGFELNALKGAGRLLQGCSAIHCEVQNIELYAGAPLYPELRSWLGQRGFRPVFEAVFRRGGNVLFAR